MITRDAEKKLRFIASKFKAVALTGPRQSGKTTLVKTVFQNKPYVSLENPDHRRFALEDPRGFLDSYKNGAIIDEAQRAPELFSYLQEILDNTRKKGLFVLTGSNNFLLLESISQSLAGRIAYLNLLPFSLGELTRAKKCPAQDNELMFKGFYPPVYQQRIPASDWCANYIRTYIERDVRQIKNITDLIVFERFMRLLAARCSQELNMSDLANESGTDVKTIQSWLGILEASFIIFPLKPHFKNYSKTIVKRPKIYFYDTALVCYLNNITSAKMLNTHALRGHIFENMVVTEFVKAKTHLGEPLSFYYWRDKTGHEVDLIEDIKGKLLPFEIKSGMTVKPEFLKNLSYWMKLSGSKKGIVLYAGKQNEKRSTGLELIYWRDYLMQNVERRKNVKK